MSVLVGAADPQQDFSAWLGAQGMKPRFAEAMDRDLGINDYDDLLACTEDAQVLVEFFNVAREKLPFAPYAVLRRIIKMVISEKERGDGHRNSNEEASVELLTEQPVVLGLLQTMVALLSNLGQELFQAAERFGALTDTFHSNTPDENEDVHTNEFVGVGEEGSLVVKVEDLNTSIRPNFEDDAVPMWKNYGSDDVTTDVRLIGGSESAPLPGRKEGEDSLNEVVEDPNVEEELKEGYGGDEEESHPDKCDSSMITGGSQWWPCKVKSEPSFGDSGGAMKLHTFPAGGEKVFVRIGKKGDSAQLLEKRSRQQLRGQLTLQAKKQRRKKSKGIRIRQWKDEDMQNAMEDFKTGQFGIRHLSRAWNIPRSTLQKRLKGLLTHMSEASILQDDCEMELPETDIAEGS
uniref:uncharacterized protein isoform X2 n=1 Tax=Myxine glutinosa TaxID=7769 RepID=UPI00358E80A8